MFKYFVMTVLLSPALQAQALTPLVYTGEARDKKEQVVYIEKHRADFLAKKIQKARTEYVRQDGQLIAVIESDFKENVTVPNYVFKDERNGSSHGITMDGDKYVVWNQEKGKDKEQKIYLKSDFDKEDLVVGCQGLHYYLLDNLSVLRDKKKLSVKYIIPGRLDFFSFTLKIKNEDEEFIHLRLSINSIFLKLFASDLDIKYRKSDLRLIEYSGPSNLLDDSGGTQNVKIKYSYEGGAP